MNESSVSSGGDAEESIRQLFDRLIMAGILDSHVMVSGELYVRPTERGARLFHALREINLLLGGITAADAAKIFYMACHMPDDYE